MTTFLLAIILAQGITDDSILIGMEEPPTLFLSTKKISACIS